MTEELTFQEQSVVWGQVFEILVQRGVLGCLADWKLIGLDAEHLKPWRTTKVANIHRGAIRELQVIDETVKEQQHSALQHLAAVAYGLGYTAMRAYLRKLDQPLGNRSLKVRALWCPLVLPGAKDRETERANACGEIHHLLNLTGRIDPALADKGMPANAD